MTDGDAEAVVDLVRTCWSEYEGCIYDEEEMRHLRQPASHYAAAGGVAWVAVDAEAVVRGSVALRPASEQGVVELQLMYVRPESRRQGVATALVEILEAEARRRGARSIELWSDSRFATAHRMYLALGYRRLAGERHLPDVSASIEYPFRKELDEELRHEHPAERAMSTERSER